MTILTKLEISWLALEKGVCLLVLLIRLLYFPYLTMQLFDCGYFLSFKDMKNVSFQTSMLGFVMNLNFLN